MVLVQHVILNPLSLLLILKHSQCTPSTRLCFQIFGKSLRLDRQRMGETILRLAFPEQYGVTAIFTRIALHEVETEIILWLGVHRSVRRYKLKGRSIRKAENHCHRVACAEGISSVSKLS